MVELSKLITEESRMTEEMRSLVRARNFEVERIKHTCEQTLAQSVTDATEFDKHSYEISMLNEKLRQVSINYSHQIEALNEHQRHEYRQLVRTILLPCQCFCTGTPTNHHSFHDHLKSHVTFMRFENYGPTPTTFSDIAIVSPLQHPKCPAKNNAQRTNFDLPPAGRLADRGQKQHQQQQHQHECQFVHRLALSQQL
ncbi:hypothetical protein niasHT_025392 [Heterodera trifolii]|uniref:Uncharacterized protein n=1 Tax=Heterodera trifolii TaxID=157864 RepID=A0ABD2KFG1_9BILA